MVNNNKILTVSYGTFSCTLEGFDDSFSTMKAIAEYFRDLASDDRYFGAEPPQLDAEMLARIAQRQISSPVAAYESDTGIVLRAGETDTVAEAKAPDTAPTPEVAQAPEVRVAPAAPVAEELVEDTIEVAEEPAQKAPTDDPVAQDVPADAAPEVAAPEIAAMQEYIEPEVVKKEDVAPAADSIAAKLQRIRAVVSQNESSAKAVDFSEDEHADAFMGAPSVLQNDDFEDEDLIATDEVSEDLVIDEPANDSIALNLADVMAEDNDLDEDIQDEVAEADEDIVPDETGQDDDETEDETEDEIAKALAEFETIDSEETTDQSDNEDTSGDVAETEDDDLFGDDEDVDVDDDDDLANLLADVRDTNKSAQTPAAGRVLKIKRADFEEAIETGKIEAVDVAEESAETTLSDADEAELLRELAEVEAESVNDPELDANADDHKIDDENVATADDPLEADFAYDDDDAEDNSELPPAVNEDENDLSRLMDAADTKMDEPETTSRREAYSHLRAAVTVANAEHAAGGSVESDTDDGAYRDDLASVVRPRRPETAANATPTERPSRPVAGKPAPLKLVAEQRVDDQAEQAPRGPVRPRRVSAVQVEETPIDGEERKGGFAKFAQEMEATNLKELLEAAAAYLSFVEGREHFSRPQLMTKVRQVETSEFNREDGLRSFGKLLREGKIQKTSGGRFTASEDIGFRPDEREAG
jgi:ribonuclease E